MLIKFDTSDELTCYTRKQQELSIKEKKEIDKITLSITKKIENKIIPIHYDLSIGMLIDFLNFQNILELTNEEIDFLLESCNNYARICRFIMHPDYLIVEIEFN